MRFFLFEIRYFLVFVATMSLLLQFALLAWLQPRLPRVIFWPLALPFVVQDILYQLIIGTFLFWERPRELFFTTRLKRLDGTNPHVQRFKDVLNELDEGHV